MASARMRFSSATLSARARRVSARRTSASSVTPAVSPRAGMRRAPLTRPSGTLSPLARRGLGCLDSSNECAGENSNGMPGSLNRRGLFDRLEQAWRASMFDSLRGIRLAFQVKCGAHKLESRHDGVSQPPPSARTRLTVAWYCAERTCSAWRRLRNSLRCASRRSSWLTIPLRYRTSDSGVARLAQDTERGCAYVE